MIMKIKELISLLEQEIPKELSENWDNDGAMIVPNSNAEVKKVLVALDCTGEAIDEAINLGCNVIVTHHPLVFRPVNRILDTNPTAKRMISCIENGIAVLSYHTRLDSMDGGVNDCLAERIGLYNAEAFVPYGRVGEFGYERDFADFIEDIEKKLDEKPQSIVNRGGSVKKVALVSGGGKGEVLAAFNTGADTYLTGEASHDALIEAAELGMNMVCFTHHATERVVLPALKEIVEECGAEAVVFDFDTAVEYGV